MAYYHKKLVFGAFHEVLQKIESELKAEGFGILTEIDVQATLKKKLDVDFRQYKILGACNPPFAYKALQLEENIGVLLPCNVVVQEKEKGEIQVSVVNPLESMRTVGNEGLSELAAEVSVKLSRVLANLR